MSGLWGKPPQTCREKTVPELGSPPDTQTRRLPLRWSRAHDGKPLPTGELHFGVHGAPPSVLKVKDGTFSGQAPIGQNKVELFILADGPPNPKYKESGAASKINTAPGKYWGPYTALDAPVSATGPNEFKFDISSR